MAVKTALAAPEPDPFAPTTEKAFTEIVRRMAKRYGVLYYHTFDPRHSAPGFPDFVFLGPGGIAYRELKTDKGKLSLAQMQWITLLGQVGADVGIWRPADLNNGVIHNTLARLCKPAPRIIPPMRLDEFEQLGGAL